MGSGLLLCFFLWVNIYCWYKTVLEAWGDCSGNFNLWLFVTASQARCSTVYCIMLRTCQGHFLSCSLWKYRAAACQHKPADPGLNNSVTPTHADKHIRICKRACKHTYIPINSPWTDRFNFRSIFLVQKHHFALYQLLILSAHIMEKCL